MVISVCDKVKVLVHPPPLSINEAASQEQIDCYDKEEKIPDNEAHKAADHKALYIDIDENEYIKKESTLVSVLYRCY